jgi:hypothetical protein
VGSLSQPKYSSELLSLDAVQQGIPCYCDTARTLLPPPHGSWGSTVGAAQTHPMHLGARGAFSLSTFTPSTATVEYRQGLSASKPCLRLSSRSLATYAPVSVALGAVQIAHSSG